MIYIKIIFCIIVFTKIGCSPPMIKALKNTQVVVAPNVFDIVPIIDKNGKSHKYTTPNLETYNDNQVWCETHLKWEEVSVIYEPTILSKLRKIEYIVEEKANEKE